MNTDKNNGQLTGLQNWWDARPTANRFQFALIREICVKVFFLIRVYPWPSVVENLCPAF